MFVFVDGGQRKNLWIDGGFEIENKPDGFRVQLAYADLLDIRIVRLDFRDQFFQSRIQFGSVYIDDKPVRVGEQEMFCIVEWAEKADTELPPPDLAISLEVKGDGRTVSLTASSDKGRHCLENLHYTSHS